MMRRFLGLAILLTTTGFLASSAAQGQQKGLIGPGGEIESDKLTPGTFVGRLQGAVSPGADFELGVEFKRVEINQQALRQAARGGGNAQQLIRAQQQIARAQQQMARARNPQEQARAMQQMQRTMQQMQLNQLRQQVQGNRGGNNVYKLVSESKDIKFHAGDDLIIRRATPPMEFDDKGNIKAMTPENLRALKGSNPRLPGYEGKLEDLKSGAVVQVTLRRNTVDPNDPDPNAHRNVVTMIMVQQDGQDTPGRGKR